MHRIILVAVTNELTQGRSLSVRVNPNIWICWKIGTSKETKQIDISIIYLEFYTFIYLDFIFNLAVHF
jgi:hypothetical protein